MYCALLPLGVRLEQGREGGDVSYYLKLHSKIYVLTFVAVSSAGNTV